MGHDAVHVGRGRVREREDARVERNPTPAPGSQVREIGRARHPDEQRSEQGAVAVEHDDRRHLDHQARAHGDPVRQHHPSMLAEDHERAEQHER